MRGVEISEGDYPLGRTGQEPKEAEGSIFRQKQGTEMEARVGKAFFKPERDSPNQHKDPAP